MATYYFGGDLRIPMAETVGPITNSRSVNLLHPDMCQSDVDLGRTRVTQRCVDRSTWLPDVLRNNKVMVSGYDLDADGDIVARSPYMPDGRTFDPKVMYIETDAVKGAYMTAHYGHDAAGIASQPDAEKVLFWAIV